MASNQNFTGINNLINDISQNSNLTQQEVSDLIRKISKIINIEKRFKQLRQIIKNEQKHKRQSKEIQVVFDAFDKTKETLKPLQEDIKKLVGEKQYFLLIDFIKKSV